MTTSLDMAISDIRNAYNVGLFYASLLTTLSLPHICSALEDPQNRSNGDAYKSWYKKYVEAKFRGFFSAEACYSLRCGIIHQRQGSVAGHEMITQVIFRLPDSDDIQTIHGNIRENVLQFELNKFNEEFIVGAEEWQRQNCNNPTVQFNLRKLITFYSTYKLGRLELGKVLA